MNIYILTEGNLTENMNGLLNTGHTIIIGKPLTYDPDGLYIEKNYYRHQDNYLKFKNNYINQCDRTDEEMISLLEKYDIPFPKTIFQDKITTLLTCMEPNKEYAVKSYGAARSIGKYKTDRTLFLDMLNRISIGEFKSKEEFNTYYGINGGIYRNDDDKYRLYDSLCKDNVYLQEYIDIKKEYRLFIYFDHEPNVSCLLRKGYSLNPKASDMDEDYVEYNTILKEHKQIDTIVKRFIDMMKQEKNLTLSIDIAIDQNNDAYVIEFSREYSIDNKDIFNLHQDKIKKAINEYIEYIK